jgi:hypothetical protein
MMNVLNQGTDRIRTGAMDGRISPYWRDGFA